MQRGPLTQAKRRPRRVRRFWTRACSDDYTKPTSSQPVISDYVSLTSDHLINLLAQLFVSSQAFSILIFQRQLLSMWTHTSGLRSLLLHLNQVIRARFARTSVKHAQKEKNLTSLTSHGHLHVIFCPLQANWSNECTVRSCLMWRRMMMMMMLGNVFAGRIVGRMLSIAPKYEGIYSKTQ